MTGEGATFHHYKLNFNAAGILEMICSKIEPIAEPDAPPNGGQAKRFGNSGVGGGPPSVS